MDGIDYLFIKIVIAYIIKIEKLEGQLLTKTFLIESHIMCVRSR